MLQHEIDSDLEQNKTIRLQERYISGEPTNMGYPALYCPILLKNNIL
jgi:hypothetical protein